MRVLVDRRDGPGEARTLSHSENCTSSGPASPDFHCGCFACGIEHPLLGLRFRPTVDEGLEAVWQPAACWQGYDGILHGGIIATLLDAAMTRWLLDRGIPARTTDLRICYRRPVSVLRPVTVIARAQEPFGPLHRLRAQLTQDGRIMARAEGCFMLPREKP